MDTRKEAFLSIKHTLAETRGGLKGKDMGIVQGSLRAIYTELKRLESSESDKRVKGKLEGLGALVYFTRDKIVTDLESGDDISVFNLNIDKGIDVISDLVEFYIQDWYK